MDAEQLRKNLMERESMSALKPPLELAGEYLGLLMGLLESLGEEASHLDQETVKGVILDLYDVNVYEFLPWPVNEVLGVTVRDFARQHLASGIDALFAAIK